MPRICFAINDTRYRLPMFKTVARFDSPASHCHREINPENPSHLRVEPAAINELKKRVDAVVFTFYQLVPAIFRAYSLDSVVSIPPAKRPRGN